MKRHSDSEQRVFEYIQTAIAEHGYAPSVREIGKAVGLKSSSTVQLNITRLQEKGLLQKTEKAARSIVLAEKQEKNKIPVFDGKSIGGTPSEYILYESDGHESEYFALKVEDDTLADDGIFAGSIAIVHSRETPLIGDLFAVRTDDTASIRKMSREVRREVDCGGTVLGRVVAVVMRFV